MAYFFYAEQQQVYVTIDTRNWFWGKSKINLLVVGVAYEGLAMPLFWHLLPKAGNATAKVYIVMVE